MTEKFENLINHYQKLADILEVECEVSGFASDFGCYPNTKEVKVGLLVPYTEMKYFQDLVWNTAKHRWEIPTICFVHELGHLKTDFLLSDTQKKYDEQERQKPNLTIVEYRNLPSEKFADQWAIEILLQNKTEIILWEQELMALYNNISFDELVYELCSSNE